MNYRLLIGLAALSLAQPALAAPARKSAEERAAEAAGAAAAAGGDAEIQINAIRVLDDDPAGPMLNAVIVYNPNAPEDAVRDGVLEFLIGLEDEERFGAHLDALGAGKFLDVEGPAGAEVFLTN